MMAERPYLDEASLGRFLRERLDPNMLGDARVPESRVSSGRTIAVSDIS